MNEKFIPVNPFTRAGNKRTFTRNIVWHYTANPSASAYNHFIYFGTTLPARNRAIIAEAAKLTGEAKEKKMKEVTYASAHIFIDPVETLCIIPLDEISYHASQANPYSVGVELCIESDGSFHPNTYKQAVALGVELARLYNLNPLTDFIRHFDVTGKLCPKRWVEHSDEWEAFKKEVNEQLKGGKPKLERWVANTIYFTWIKPEWEKANAANDQQTMDNMHLLANKLRVACGMKEDEDFE